MFNANLTKIYALIAIQRIFLFLFFFFCGVKYIGSQLSLTLNKVHIQNSDFRTLTTETRQNSVIRNFRRKNIEGCWRATELKEE